MEALLVVVVVVVLLLVVVDLLPLSDASRRVALAVVALGALVVLVSQLVGCGEVQDVPASTWGRLLDAVTALLVVATAIGTLYLRRVTQNEGAATRQEVRQCVASIIPPPDPSSSPEVRIIDGTDDERPTPPSKPPRNGGTV